MPLLAIPLSKRSVSWGWPRQQPPHHPQPDSKTLGRRYQHYHYFKVQKLWLSEVSNLFKFTYLVTGIAGYRTETANIQGSKLSTALTCSLKVT